MKETTLKMGKGTKTQVKPSDNHWVFCNSYEGKFRSRNLDLSAEVGGWFTYGQPFAEEGHGHTPEAAIKDAIKRTEIRINAMEAAIRELKGALDACGDSVS